MAGAGKAFNVSRLWAYRGSTGAKEATRGDKPEYSAWIERLWPRAPNLGLDNFSRGEIRGKEILSVFILFLCAFLNQILNM